MIDRRDVLSKAADDCIKELYSLAVPKVEWKDFVKQNEIYIKKHEEWEDYKKAEKENKKLYKEYNEKLGWEGKTIVECIGPKPYEFYYLPKEIFKDVVDNYVYAYEIDAHQRLLDTIEILKKYCEDPIKDKWIEGKDGNPGHKGYEHPANLREEIIKTVISVNPKILKSIVRKISSKSCDKFFEFLDMAGEFYNWNSDLSAFNQTVYLGATPSSNKEAVIENWKKYRNKDIEIDEEQMKKDYYGEELD